MKKLTEFLINNSFSEKIAADAADKFRVYRDFLIEKNKQFNLTAITEPEEIEIKHFIDSLAALPYIEGNVADIGTGAGFPGLALKIMMPDSDFTLIDSLNKRIEFLNDLIFKLQLEKVQTLHARAEELDKTVKYNTVVARAVSKLNTLCEYTLPFVKTGGKFIAYKSENCDDEIKEAKNAISVLGGELENVVSVKLPYSDITRKLVLIKKMKETPLKYPRNQNKPRKQPL